MNPLERIVRADVRNHYALRDPCPQQLRDAERPDLIEQYARLAKAAEDDLGQRSRAWDRQAAALEDEMNATLRDTEKRKVENAVPYPRSGGVTPQPSSGGASFDDGWMG